MRVIRRIRPSDCVLFVLVDDEVLFEYDFLYFTGKGMVALNHR